MNSKILVTNIQRFSLHDGPGIRTTVFLKGCSLRCPWCANPENLSNLPQQYVKDNHVGTYGRYYTSGELLREVLKDKAFYEGKIDNWSITKAEEIELLPGGVTFSGGECLLQMPFLAPLCKALHESGVHMAVETSLFVPSHLLTLAFDYMDFFFVDMKILDRENAKVIERGNLELYLDNLHTLLVRTDKQGRKKPVVIRVPVIGSYTDIPENRTAVKKLLSKYRKSILKIELIKEHNLGENKYRSLNMKIDYHGVEDSTMEVYKNELADLGVPTEVCMI